MSTNGLRAETQITWTARGSLDPNRCKRGEPVLRRRRRSLKVHNVSLVTFSHIRSALQEGERDNPTRMSHHPHPGDVERPPANEP